MEEKPDFRVEMSKKGRVSESRFVVSVHHFLSVVVFGMVSTGWSLFLPLTTVAELVRVVRTEVSVAPDVELRARGKHFTEHN